MRIKTRPMISRAFLSFYLYVSVFSRWDDTRVLKLMSSSLDKNEPNFVNC